MKNNEKNTECENISSDSKQEEVKKIYWNTAEYSLMIYILSSTFIISVTHTMHIEEISKSSIILGGVLLTFIAQMFNNFLMSRFELMVEEFDEKLKKPYVLRLKYISSSFSTLLIISYLTYILITFFDTYLYLFIPTQTVLCLIFLYLVLSSINTLLKK